MNVEVIVNQIDMATTSFMARNSDQMKSEENMKLTLSSDSK